jgi:hypothetical protein
MSATRASGPISRDSRAHRGGRASPLPAHRSGDRTVTHKAAYTTVLTLSKVSMQRISRQTMPVEGHDEPDDKAS